METSIIQPIRIDNSSSFIFAGHQKRYSELTMRTIPELSRGFGQFIDTLPKQGWNQELWCYLGLLTGRAPDDRLAIVYLSTVSSGDGRAEAPSRPDVAL